jgi:urea carboxylase
MRYELRSPVTGSVWTHAGSIGQQVCAGALVVVLECMKMEVPFLTPVAGTIVELTEPGTQVADGDVIAVLTCE